MKSRDVNFRYVSPPEAFLRIYAKPFQAKSHTIVRLAIYLPNEKSVIFNKGEENFAVTAAARKKKRNKRLFSSRRTCKK